MLKKYLILTWVCLSISNVYADDSLFNKVRSKLKTDKQAMSQFKYLGVLHCLDERLNTSDHELFTQEHIQLFNGLFALPRLIREDSMEHSFTQLEQKYLGRVQKYENSVDKCQRLYASQSANRLYYQLIANQKNYFNPHDEHYFAKGEFQQHMRDYLKMGKIDAKRFF